MSQRFRPCDFNQIYLLPPSLQDWLPENHLARFIAEVAGELDLRAIYASYERKDGRGQPGYHPLLLLRVLLYAYSKGVTSSRRIERAIVEDVGFRFLAANQAPDHDTIASFRQRHLGAISELFIQVLRLCQKAGLVKLGNLSIDGTKMMANASGRRNASYTALEQSEKYWQSEVTRLLNEAQRTDEEEDARWGKGKSEASLPTSLATASQRLEHIRKGMRELSEEAKQQTEQVEAENTTLKASKPAPDASEAEKALYQQKRERLKKRRQRARANDKQPARQYNVVDPDSRSMHDNGRKCQVQGYNAQAAVDGHAQVIVAAEITQQCNDRAQLVPMVEQARKNLEADPEVITADTGYWDTSELQDPRLAGLDILVPPDGACRHGDSGGELPANAPRAAIAERMRERLKTEEGRLLYGVRKRVVEPVFGQIKQARGIRRFWLRGIDQVAAEWKLICATHNLLKVFRSRQQAAAC